MGGDVSKRITNRDFSVFGYDHNVEEGVKALNAWADKSPTVLALSSFATQYKDLFAAASAFGTVFTVVGIAWSMYSFYQTKKDDKENAKMIVEQIVEQVKGMIDRATKDIKEHFDEGRLKDCLIELEANRRGVQFWLSTAADSNFEDMQDELSARLIVDAFKIIAGLESFLEDAIEARNGASAAAIYRHLVEAVQQQNLALAVKDQNGPHASNATAIENINRLLAFYPRVLAAIRTTLDSQFFGPVLWVQFPYIAGPTWGPKWFVWYFRGEKRDVGPPDNMTEAKILEYMEGEKEEEYRLFTESMKIGELDAENRKALAEINALP